MSASPYATPPQAPNTAAVLAAALAYRQDFGWSVIPTHPTTKKPLVKWEDFQRTPADEATIREWYRRWPFAGVAIVTGAVSRLWVVDVDSDAGRAQLEPLPLPPVPTVKTGKGEHRYFSRPGALRNTAKKIDGVDTRGDGGYVIAPPSIHPSGVPYAWSVSPWDTAPQDPPAALVELFTERTRGRGDERAPGDDADMYARMLEDGSPDGQRHHDMIKLVGHYIARGLSPREIAILLRPWVDRCQPIFPYHDLDNTIRDLIAAEARKKTLEDAPPTIDAAAREIIATQRAELADWKAQAKAWEHLFTNRALPDKAKRVLVHMHKRFGVPVGRPLPDTMPCSLYADEQDLKAEGLPVTAYKEGRDILLGLDLVVRQQVMKKATTMKADDADEDPERRPRARGKDWFYAWGLNAGAVSALWQELPTMTEIAPTERQVKAEKSREERLERAIAEERPTPQVVAVLKREARQERAERDRVTYQRDALAYERDSARDALQEAQRIIQQSQRPVAESPLIMCRAGCGSFITPADWCCDECREREREEADDSKLDSNPKSQGAQTVGVTYWSTSNFESDAAPGLTHKPCPGGCGVLTPHGWTCKPCRERPIGSLHIHNGSATGQEGRHGR